MTAIPEAFKHKLRAFFGEEVQSRVLNGMQQEAAVAIRANPLKPSVPYDNTQPIPWSKNGHLLNHRPNFAYDPHFHAGAYYVQDPSSMILEEVLGRLEISASLLALDMCAAPGGKSTILLDYLHGDGFLVSNEIDPKRNAILRENLLKWGRLNHAVTALQTTQFERMAGTFDLILIDAPCSGEGMFRKDPFAREQWSDKLIIQCCEVQKSIIQSGITALKNNGILIYSTCTLNPIENEAHIASMLLSGEFEMALPELDDFSDYLVPAKMDGELVGYYLMPGISIGEGLFISCLRKKSGNESIGRAKHIKRPSYEAPHAEFMARFNISCNNFNCINIRDEWHAVANNDFIKDLDIPFKSIGLPIYQIKGKDIIPLHGLAMSMCLKPDIHLIREAALQFLRKESISLPPETQKGWQLVAFESHPLGWIKAMDNRSNNYYPSHYRLRT